MWEYREKFELLLGQLMKILETMLDGNFVKRLKPNICIALLPLEPRGLNEAMKLTQLIEDQHAARRVIGILKACTLGI